MSVLEGRRVVVTGSGRGIGRAIARDMAAEGAHVVVSARNIDEIEAAADEIREAGGVAHAIRCDISSDDDVARLADTAVERLGGPVDTLVNNAGAYKPSRFLDYDLSDWSWLLDVNVVGSVRVTMAFLPGMLELDRARVIFLASIAGKKGSFGQSAYNASKHAQVGLTRCLALETGHTGVRVNAICPGFTMTDLIDLDEIAEVYDTTPDEAWTRIEAASTIGRTVSADEIAALAVYLASPAADGVNGQSLAIDGGITYA